MTATDASSAATAAAGTAADAFISKWRGVPATELSASQSFLLDLCALLGVDAPHATEKQDYMFERPVTFRHGDGSTSAGRIDLYRRGAFVLESKRLKAGPHTRGFDEAMLRARSQAENYARALPASEGRPPFLLVVDVGQRIELYAEFSRSGATYTPFPDPRSHRIELELLRDSEVRERLRRVWTDPLSLDPSRESARVTRQIAGDLAELAKRLEQAGHLPEAVASFLMRCLFTMFAEDVRLLPADSFRELLLKHADNPDVAMRMLALLWQDMDRGGFSGVLASDVLRFNGKLFKTPDTLPLDNEQLQLLLRAARADWKHVEPAIFGTLLERALEPGERHKLGAHYTPRAYVERLVLPTVIEPLRAEWADAHAAALVKNAEAEEIAAQIALLPARSKAEKNLADRLRNARRNAIEIMMTFHHRLCTVRVLDPACGSGNFLYVTLEHLKRLEGEVLNALDELGYRQTGLALDGERADARAGETVDPHNLLGIELNPRAAAIAEVVLWIGYLQWHFRTRGDVNPPIPVIRDFRNIENRDAVLAYDGIEQGLDPLGNPVTRWDGKTMKRSPVTGDPVPDESAQIPIWRYLNPSKALWPSADFVIGNPPFIGNKRMRAALGDGYVEALRATWDDVPETSDFVMYWWHHAAQLMRSGSLQRFGLITTNSVSQAFNRRVIESAMEPVRVNLPMQKDGRSVALNFARRQERISGGSVRIQFERPVDLSLSYAIPDHPWVDSSDGAAVRIAMTVATPGKTAGILHEIVEERPAESEIAVVLRAKHGLIQADLTVGAKVSCASKLRGNSRVCFQGMNLVGKGFRLESSEVEALGYVISNLPDTIKPHCNARDLMQGGGNCYVIDFFGYDEDRARDEHPALYQRLFDRVKPERDHNNDIQRRRNWWLFGRANTALRASWEGLSRMILTPETAKHRVFTFVDRPFCPDHKLYAICVQDAVYLGVLSSIIHRVWALSAGGTLEDRPTWTNTTCFATFPFPNATLEQADRIRSVAERLDVHRKCQQASHSSLTLTGIYNVLEKLRSGDTLTPKERVIHDQGLVSVLRQMHDDLDTAVLEAYGWSDLLPLLRVAHGNKPPGESVTRDDAKRTFDEAILDRLVSLNAERAAAETRGDVLWLRPEFQNPAAQEAAAQHDMDGIQTDDGAPDTPTPIAAARAKPWPSNSVDQVRAIAEVVSASPVPLSIDDIASQFSARGQWKKRLPQLLEMLVAVGRACEVAGRYRAT